ncbi:hypothetical protein KJ966_26930 [bacterium]|nr:hypothetical protein [bacterium]
MTQYVTNRLYFKTNSKTILIYLKSKALGSDSPDLFSLNSIKMTPVELILPLTNEIRTLSIMNADRPSLSEPAGQIALSNLFDGQEKKENPSEIQKAIGSMKGSLQKVETEKGKMDYEVFEKALSNYEQTRFFSFYDWRLAHWGVVDDIHSVVESTFKRPTTCIEFETTWVPPMKALNNLANTFPSVRFELQSRYNSSDPWEKTELFPAIPFGY